jgi:carbon-monoxide dehydrogenase medium subunit
LKPSNFVYIKATTTEDVFTAFERYGDDARILAGGQSLVPAMNLRLSAPEALIDINGLSELSTITLTDDSLRIGALVRHSEVATSETVAKHCPLLAKAAPFIAHQGIRNRGTFGGSIVNADPASEFPACIVALDARVIVAGRSGQRTVDAKDFFLGVYETAIKPDEILLHVDIPLYDDTYVSGFSELAHRHGDYATAGLAVHGRISEGIFSDMRLVLFGVSDRPVQSSVAAVLEGASVSQDTIATARERVGENLDLVGDVHTSAEIKAHLVKVLCGRVLQEMSEI